MTTAKTALQEPPAVHNDFLSLFPHRFDFIYAKHPEPHIGHRSGKKPLVQWHTQSRYPLSDALIQQGAYLYGVRFGKTTRYAMLDIDRASAYHPRKDPRGIGRIQDVMERLGLVRSIICRSSDSEGLHLYFPFEEDIPSYKIGKAITLLLRSEGIAVAGGQVEVFPNARRYSESLSLYNGHRLPLLRIDSYILNADFEPCSESTDVFVKQWQTAIAANNCNELLAARIIKQLDRKVYGHISTSAETYLNDLNARIELGWYEQGQTNDLLFRIAQRSYVFGHVLKSIEPLEGEALATDIARVASNLPGFHEYCGHIHHIEKRAREQAKYVESQDKFYHYGGRALKLGQPDKPEGPSWNEQQSQVAREKIRLALAKMLEKGTLPAGIRARFVSLKERGIGSSTLYRHKDLWHPEILGDLEQLPLDLKEAESADLGVRNSEPKSLFTGKDRINLSDKGFEDVEKVDDVAPGGNDAGVETQEGADRVVNPLKEGEAACYTPMPRQLWQRIQRQLHEVQQRLRGPKQENLDRHREDVHNAHIAELRAWLASGDPILMQEARLGLMALGLFP